MNKPFFNKKYIPVKRDINIDKIPNEDLCSIRINNTVKYDGDKTIITKEKNIVNLTRKVNETAKALKAKNADLISKMNKLFEAELNNN